jgi:polyisoprenyl-phosphate glycosyltransferase
MDDAVDGVTGFSEAAPRGVDDPLLPDLCIVVPAHNEETNLPILVRELAHACDPAGVRIELLIVDDGSRDNTAAVIRELAARHPHVRGLRLSRNFGHQPAVSTGLRYARGLAIAVMDADLQDTPADLLQLYERWKQGADVVFAVRKTRREHVLKRIAYKTFYKILARLAKTPVQLDSGDFCVMDAAFVDKLNALPERLRFVRGLRAWLGGTQVGVDVDRAERRTGVTQYSIARLFRLAFDGIISFSDAPLRLATAVGACISLLAFSGVVVVLAWRWLGMLPTGSGLATIALSILFLGGVQLLAIGLLGEYIGRIYDEVKARPVAVIAETMNGPGGECAPSVRQAAGLASPAHEEVMP